MAPIVKPIKKIIKPIIDIIKDVGDFVQDDIVIPVVEGFEDVYKAIEDDPVRSIAYIAASFGPVWLLPLVVAADTMESGGDVDDALEASAKAYAMQYVGGEVGAATTTAVGSSTTAATIGATVGVSAQTVGAVAAGAAVGATSAIILGEDPVQAALMGGAQAGVSAAMASVRQNVSGYYADQDPILSDELAISGQKPTIEAVPPIPKAVLNVVESQLRYTLSGGDGVVSPAVMQQAIMRATITTTTMQEFLNNAGYEPTDAQLAALTNGVIQTTLAATQGGNVSGTIMKSIIDYSAKSLVESFGSEAKTTIDKVTGSYEETEKKAKEYDFVAAEKEAAEAEYNRTVTQGNEAKQKYDALRAEVEPRFAERDRLKAEMESAKQTFLNSPADNAVRNANNSKYNSAIQAYNTHTTQLDKDYSENYKDNLEQYRNEANTAYEKAQEYVPQLNTLTERANELYSEYNVLQESLVQDAGSLDEALKPTYKATNQAFVKGMTNDTFNAEEYARLNGLEDAGETGEEIDPFYHWLTTGKEEKLPVNMEQYNGQVEQQKKDLLLKSVEASGVDILTLGKDGLKQFQDQIDANYGNDLDGLKNATPETLAPSIAEYYLSETLKPNPEDSIDEAYAKEKFSEKLPPTPESITFDELKEIVGDPELKYISKTSKDAILNTLDVPDMDIISDNAAIDIDKEGNITWSKIDPTSGLQAYWDSTSGSMVEEKWDAKAKKYFTVEAGTDNVVKEEIESILNKPLIFSDLKEKNSTVFLNTLSGVDAAAGEAYDKINGSKIYNTVKTLTNIVYPLLGSNLTEKEADQINGSIISGVANVGTWVNNLGMMIRPAIDVLDKTGTTGDFLDQLDIDVNIKPNEAVKKMLTDMTLFASGIKGEEMNSQINKFQTNVANANIDTVKSFFDGRPNPNYGKPLENLSTWDKVLNTSTAFFGNISPLVAQDAIITELTETALTGAFGKGVKLSTQSTIRNAYEKSGKEVSEKFVKEAGNKAGISAAATAETAEAYVTSAMGAYDQSYQEAINQGKNGFEAHGIASEHGAKVGMAAAVFQGISRGVLGANNIENLLVTGKSVSALGDAAIKTFVKNVGKEVGSEIFEETSTAGYQGFLVTRDINKDFDTTGSMTAAAYMSALTAGGTSGTISGGIQTKDFITNAISLNPEVQNIFADYDGTSEGLDTATNKLETLGIADNNIKTNFLKVMSPSDYTTQNDIIDATKDVSGTYTFDNNEVNQLQLDYVGKTSETDFKSGFDTYVDKGTVDRQEILDAAATENVTLTEDQIKQYIGQKNEVETITGAKIEFDPLGTTTTEATDFFKAIGYTPTGTEITQFTAPVSEVEQREAIGKFVDPRMTDRGEVEAYFSEIGFTPTENDITQFIGQIEETKQKVAIGEFTDPKMVDETEAFEAFKTAGLEGARPDDIQSLIGQYDENLLAGKVEEALPGARYNVLDYNLGEQTKKVDALTELLGTKDVRINSLTDLIGAPASEDATATGLYGTLANQEAETKQIANVLGKPATDTDIATGLYSTLANQQTDFNTQLNQQTQDFNALINQQATDAKATADAAAEKEEAERVAASTRAAQNQQLQNVQSLYSSLQSTPATTDEVELANIGGPYDFQSIFRDAGQEAFYQTPYRKGGQVTNTNDRLLKLIGGN